jgi:hypothetical protein
VPGYSNIFSIHSHGYIASTCCCLFLCRAAKIIFFRNSNIPSTSAIQRVYPTARSQLGLVDTFSADETARALQYCNPPASRNWSSAWKSSALPTCFLEDLLEAINNLLTQERGMFCTEILEEAKQESPCTIRIQRGSSFPALFYLLLNLP